MKKKCSQVPASTKDEIQDRQAFDATEDGKANEPEKGQAAVEYILVVSVVLVGLMPIFETLIATLQGLYHDLTSILMMPLP
ncbi:MAG: hypothetical protein QF437_26375 [Planctomycetota bacterium]|jgi:Flp pilus assembly pilin Flp|nr:hypothetical protein [Planctomycetota bacterium]MDP7134052.1 hypothetical protein [Planctomycetota bacterium]MDP7252547.1 hypothetical protein [Planctomycetota bacterium]